MAVAAVAGPRKGTPAPAAAPAITIGRALRLYDVNPGGEGEEVYKVDGRKYVKMSANQEGELLRQIRAANKLLELHAQLTEAAAGKPPSLTAWSRAAAMRSTTLKRRLVDSVLAKRALVAANIALVHRIVADQYVWRTNGLSVQDLAQEGMFGLSTAADKFRPAKGARFTTYAWYWIKFYVEDAIARGGMQVSLPPGVVTQYYSLRRDLSASLEREPSEAEVERAIIERTAKRVNSRREAMLALHRGSVSLDAALAGGKGDAGEALSVPGPAAGAGEGVRERLSSLFAEVLTVRETRVVRMLYGVDGQQKHSITRCADKLCLSRKDVKKLAEGSLEKLRAYGAAHQEVMADLRRALA